MQSTRDSVKQDLPVDLRLIDRDIIQPPGTNKKIIYIYSRKLIIHIILIRICCGERKPF